MQIGISAYYNGLTGILEFRYHFPKTVEPCEDSKLLTKDEISTMKKKELVPLFIKINGIEPVTQNKKLKK